MRQQAKAFARLARRFCISFQRRCFTVQEARDARSDRTRRFLDARHVRNAMTLCYYRRQGLAFLLRIMGPGRRLFPAALRELVLTPG